MNKSLKRDSRMQDNSHANAPTKQKLQWQEIKTPSTIIHRRSCHSSCIFQNKLYVYGGYDNNEPDIFTDFYAFSLDTNQWKEVTQKGDLPGKRHSQTAIVYKEKMYMFGGVYDFMTNTNLLHIFEFRTNTWTLAKTKGNVPPIDSHRCCLYQNQMIVGLGYSQNQYNPHIFQLDLDTLTWKTIFNAKNVPTQSYPEPRANGSFTLNKNQIFIYGGRNFYQTFSDLWSFDLTKMRFSKVELINEIQGRFSHSAIIHKDLIFIFGGTQGVTHQRNDLIVIDLQRKFIKTCWPDSQQQRRKMKQESSQIVKKSRRDSATKKCQFKNSEDSNILQKKGSSYQSPGKYRSKLKEVAYYNDLYDSRRKKMDFKKKTHKNPLFSEIHQFAESKQGQNLNLTATFQILTNSIMLMQGKGQNKEEKSECNANDVCRQVPKARDNYSADLWIKQDEICMVIFGGGMHKIGFNDIIKIDIKTLSHKYKP